ncbi:hypothetical protein FG386_001310 [Cryptosporidium ryanae]|uniref:uncharacterized protein n=1 Tax=Cryptosporidium ryanae TaxID=515981 RepID=UPI00351A6528|nr:hypothetical protein FG386_001310 [Cryptosporidium ryanae]
MYNGIGLRTARGSGTSGHVQKNLSLVKPGKTHERRERTGGVLLDVDPSYLGKLPKKPDFVLPSKSRMELLEHGRLRKLEIELLEYSEYLEERGITGSELDERMENKRKELSSVLENEDNCEKRKSINYLKKKESDIAVKDESENEIEKEERLRVFREAIGLDDHNKKRQRFQRNRRGEDAEHKERVRTNNRFCRRNEKESMSYNNAGYGSHKSRYCCDEYMRFNEAFRRNINSSSRDINYVHSSSRSDSNYRCENINCDDSLFAHNYERRNANRGGNEQHSSSARNIRNLNLEKMYSRPRRPRRSRSPSTISRYRSLSRSLSP